MKFLLSITALLYIFFHLSGNFCNALPVLPDPWGGNQQLASVVERPNSAAQLHARQNKLVSNGQNDLELLASSSGDVAHLKDSTLDDSVQKSAPVNTNLNSNSERVPETKAEGPSISKSLMGALKQYAGVNSNDALPANAEVQKSQSNVPALNHSKVNDSKSQNGTGSNSITTGTKPEDKPVAIGSVSLPNAEKSTPKADQVISKPVMDAALSPDVNEKASNSENPAEVDQQNYLSKDDKALENSSTKTGQNADSKDATVNNQSPDVASGNSVKQGSQEQQKEGAGAAPTEAKMKIDSPPSTDSNTDTSKGEGAKDNTLSITQTSDASTSKATSPGSGAATEAKYPLPAEGNPPSVAQATKADGPSIPSFDGEPDDDFPPPEDYSEEEAGDLSPDGEDPMQGMDSKVPIETDGFGSIEVDDADTPRKGDDQDPKLDVQDTEVSKVQGGTNSFKVNEYGPDAEAESHFGYLLFLTIFAALAYILYLKRKKILALLLEGRRGSSGSSRRGSISRRPRTRTNSGGYSLLRSNGDEAPSSPNSKDPSDPTRLERIY